MKQSSSNQVIREAIAEGRKKNIERAKPQKVLDKRVSITLSIDDWLWVESALDLFCNSDSLDSADAAQVERIWRHVQEVILRR